MQRCTLRSRRVLSLATSAVPTTPVIHSSTLSVYFLIRFSCRLCVFETSASPARVHARSFAEPVAQPPDGLPGLASLSEIYLNSRATEGSLLRSAVSCAARICNRAMRRRLRGVGPLESAAAVATAASRGATLPGGRRAPLGRRAAAARCEGTSGRVVSSGFLFAAALRQCSRLRGELTTMASYRFSKH